MIIPIGHGQALRRMPWVTIGLIGVCVLVQAYSAVVASSSDAVLLRLGYITDSGVGLNLVTSAFVHADVLHLIGNMLFLFLAGAALEDRWGAVRYVAFYLAGAVASTLIFDALHHGEPMVLVGASGAVAAAMGAFLVCFARTQITLWYWLYRSTGTFQLAAYYALPLWLVEQLLLTSFDDGASGVAYNAHIGGFGFGVAVAVATRLLRPAAADELAVDPGPASARGPTPRRRDVEPDPEGAPEEPRARSARIDPSRPQPPPIVVACPRAATDAPIVPDAGAAPPKLLR